MKQTSQFRTTGVLAAIAAVAVAGGIPTAASAAQPPPPLKVDARGFPIGYACYRESDDAWRCAARPQRVPAADGCVPTDGGKFECFPPSDKVTAKTKMPPMQLNCSQPDGSASYVCYDVPTPAPPPPPPQSPAMPPVR